MKTFKMIDTGINLGLIIFFVILQLVRQDDSFMVGYFIVGGWQTISMIIHLLKRCFTYKGSRRVVYNWITLISWCTMPLGAFWILALTAPFMACYYTYVCYDETYRKMQRPLALLK